MSPKEFWEGDPHLAVAYREADTMRLKARNIDMWMMGKYVHEAVATAIYNNFRKDGTKAEPYLKEPYRVTPPTPEEEEAERQAEIQRIIDNLNAMQRTLDGRREQ